MSYKPIVYEVITTSDSYTHLMRVVQERLDNGWKLQGGVAVASYAYEGGIEFHYAQAVYFDPG